MCLFFNDLHIFKKYDIIWNTAAQHNNRIGILESLDFERNEEADDQSWPNQRVFMWQPSTMQIKVFSIAMLIFCIGICF